MPFSIKAQFDAVMHGPFAPHALSSPQVRQQVNGTLLEHTSANRRFDVFSAPAFQHHRINPLPGQQQREHETSRAGSNDSHLCSQVHTSSPSAADSSLHFVT